MDRHSYFNVTRSLSITSVDFRGEQMNAYYTATNELIRELPLKLCTYDPVTDKIMKEDFSFPFDYICEMPETTADSCGQ
jgi:hypothetical protein